MKLTINGDCSISSLLSPAPPEVDNEPLPQVLFLIILSLF